jgi:hypothetical protein
MARFQSGVNVTVPGEHLAFGLGVFAVVFNVGYRHFVRSPPISFPSNTHGQNVPPNPPGTIDQTVNAYRMVVLLIVFMIETISTSGRVASRAHVGATVVAEL